MPRIKAPHSKKTWWKQFGFVSQPMLEFLHIVHGRATLLQMQRHGDSTKVQANSDNPLLKDGIIFGPICFSSIIDFS